MKISTQHIKLPLWDILSHQLLVLLPGLETGNNSIEKAMVQFLFFAQKGDCPWTSAFQLDEPNIDINKKQFAYETIP